MERTLKIFFSCALGAFLGATVALNINQYFWWIGLLVGGVVGYLSYEFKKVLNAIPQAYRMVSEWKLNKGYWRRYGLTIITLMSLVLTIEIVLIIPLAIHLSDPSLLFFMTIFMLILISLLAFIILYEEVVNIEMIKIFHPLPVFFYWLPKGIWYCAIRVPGLFALVGKFIKTLFTLIHSDIRLLCGVYAAIGAGIGYFAKSPIIGMFAGGIFGVINYILVSQKILKLQAKT